MSGAKQSVCSSYLDSLPRAAFTSPLKRSESQKLNFVALDWTARRLGAIFGSLCDSLSLCLSFSSKTRNCFASKWVRIFGKKIVCKQTSSQVYLEGSTYNNKKFITPVKSFPNSCRIWDVPNTLDMVCIFFQKSGSILVSFCLFSSFSHHNSNINWKKQRCCTCEANPGLQNDVVLAKRTRGCKMVGADGSNVLWWSPRFLWVVRCLFSVYLRFFKPKLQFLQHFNVKKCPSSIWGWDSNPQPL